MWQGDIRGLQVLEETYGEIDVYLCNHHNVTELDNIQTAMAITVPTVGGFESYVVIVPGERKKL